MLRPETANIRKKRVMSLIIPVLILFVLLAAVSASAATFIAPAPYGTGTAANSFSVATGDFDNDGDDDVALANNAAGAISVFRANGDGTFTWTGVDHPVGPSGTLPDAVIAGDFNGDGNLDLATANGGTNNISVLLGNGNGAFQTAVNYATGDGLLTGFYPIAIAKVDLDNDGILDLVTANASSDPNNDLTYEGDISVLLGNGDGAFQPAATYTVGDGLATGLNPYSVVAGDFNKDGNADVATANVGSSDVSVLSGNGSGALGLPAIVSLGASTSPLSITTGDFNRDTYLDLATANIGSSDISLLFGSATGTFTAAAPITGIAGAQFITTADLNGDGNPDLATANYDYDGTAVPAVNVNDVYVLLGDGAGAFAPPEIYAVGPIPYSVAVGDFDGNAEPDLAVANNGGDGTNDISILLNEDTVPNAFTFTDQTLVPLTSVRTSNAITVSGITAPAPISVTGGTYSINGGAYTSVAGTVSNGNTVTVRQTSAATYGTTTDTVLTIGGVFDTFSVTTLPQYTVTPSSGGNGSITPDTPQLVAHSSTIAFTLTPMTGYHIDVVSGTCGGTLTGDIYTTNGVVADCTVDATFAINTYTLTVSKTGTGVGTITGDIGGISCGASCSAVYDHGTTVILSAAAGTESSFIGWSGGGCTGTGTCTVTMTAATTVNATFDDTTAPTGSILINGDAAFTTSTAVTLTLSATDAGSGIAQMQFSNDNVTWSAPEAYATSKAWTLTTGDGIKTVYARFIDNAGNVSIAYNDTIILDTTAPTVSITAPAAGLTNDNTPLLTYSVSDGTVVVKVDGLVVAKVSGDSLDALADGSHTVRVESTDLAVNTGFAAVAFTVDTVPPTVAINAVTTPTNINSQTITGTVESGATVNVATDTGASDGPATVTGSTWSYAITGLVEGANGITVTATDAAGNSAMTPSSITLDTVAPTGTIVINGDAIYANTASVILTLSATDIGGVASQMEFSNDGTTWSTPADAYGVSKAWTLTAGDGAKTVSVRFTDSAGNVSVVYSDTITLDTTPPAVAINAVTTPTNVNSQTITGTVEAGATVNVATDTAASDGAATVTGTTWSYTITGLVEGANNITVTATDAAGNSASASSGITLDTAPPAVAINAVTTPTNVSSQTITGTVEAGATVNVATDTTASDGAATVTGTTWSYTITGLVEGANNITVTATDAAGNSATTTSSITYDATAPTGSIVINAGVAYTNTALVTLTLSAADVNVVSEMRFSNDGTIWSTPEAYGTSKAWGLSAGDGVKTVYVQYQDSAGNWSTAFSDAIILDTAAPVTTASVSGAGGPYIRTQSVALSASDATATTIYYTLDGSDPTTSSTVYTAAISISSTKTVKFFAVDAATNIETIKKEVYTITNDGDLDRDGSISVVDALRALRIAAMIITATADDTTYGDVAPLMGTPLMPAPNTVINTGDVVVVLRKAVGLVSW